MWEFIWECWYSLPCTISPLWEYVWILGHFPKSFLFYALIKWSWTKDLGDNNLGIVQKQKQKYSFKKNLTLNVMWNH